MVQKGGLGGTPRAGWLVNVDHMENPIQMEENPKSWRENPIKMDEIEGYSCFRKPPCTMILKVNTNGMCCGK